MDDMEIAYAQLGLSEREIKIALRSQAEKLTEEFIQRGGTITKIGEGVTGKVKSSRPKLGRPRSPGGRTDELEADAQ